MAPSTTAPEIRAVIDIGTNSVKLLVGEVSGRSVHPLLERSEQTRLGRGFYESHILQAGPVAETARAVKLFADLAKTHRPVCIRILATSAARDAKNPEALQQAVRALTGARVDIISGDEEAHLAFGGVASTAGLESVPLLVLDIGGGSTELILGESGVWKFGESFRLGSVRLMELLSVPQSPDESDWRKCAAWLDQNLDDSLNRSILPRLAPVKESPIRLIVTGGTPAILARIQQKLNSFDRDRIEGFRMSLALVQSHRERLWKAPWDERKNIVGLPSDRADVILTGIAILEKIMKALAFDELTISTRGFRFGALLSSDC